MSSQMNIVLGAMGFGQSAAVAMTSTARIHSPEETAKILEKFTSKGYKEVDTARIYGEGTSESYLASADWKGRGVIMGTKLYPTANMPIPIPEDMKYNHHRGGVRRGLMASLKALETDKIDLFYLHGPDRTVEYEVTLRELNELHQEGLFNRWGVSNYAAWEVAQMCEICNQNGWVKPTVYQGVYSYITRSVEQELIPCLRKYGISLYVFNPLAGGLLTGKYTKDTTQFEEGSRFDDKRLLGKSAKSRYWNDTVFEAVDLVRPAADKNGLTMVECALRWLVHHSALKKDLGDAIIIGVSSLNHLESNLQDVEKGPLPEDVEKGPLPEDVVQAIDAAWGVVKGATFQYFH
ncbi:hypothetical protein TWF694_005467 [Orbilia ellipsospora]|uniref:NADP-dependent oxidoreductase domain-containing protein n=1 Tax=Orbilia ellipsospora TaxID=2528407 RepID=A0AAV9WU92_9PEZI